MAKSFPYRHRMAISGNERLLKRLSAQAGNENLRPEIPNVVTVYPGKLPISEDSVHTTAEGQFLLGKVTATAVEEFYKAKE